MVMIGINNGKLPSLRAPRGAWKRALAQGWPHLFPPRPPLNRQICPAPRLILCGRLAGPPPPWHSHARPAARAPGKSLVEPSCEDPSPPVRLTGILPLGAGGCRVGYGVYVVLRLRFGPGHAQSLSLSNTKRPGRHGRTHPYQLPPSLACKMQHTEHSPLEMSIHAPTAKSSEANSRPDSSGPSRGAALARHRCRQVRCAIRPRTPGRLCSGGGALYPSALGAIRPGPHSLAPDQHVFPSTNVRHHDGDNKADEQRSGRARSAAAVGAQWEAGQTS